MTYYTHAVTHDLPSPGAEKPLIKAAADVVDILLAENARLRDALTKIYSEAMMVYEPPELAWCRIAELADIALLRGEGK